MKQELEQHEYEDTLVMVNSLFEQYGVRAVLTDFRDHYPKMFEEVVAQVNRIAPTFKVAALLKPNL